MTALADRRPDDAPPRHRPRRLEALHGGGHLVLRDRGGRVQGQPDRPRRGDRAGPAASGPQALRAARAAIAARYLRGSRGRWRATGAWRSRATGRRRRARLAPLRGPPRRGRATADAVDTDLPGVAGLPAALRPHGVATRPRDRRAARSRASGRASTSSRSTSTRSTARMGYRPGQFPAAEARLRGRDQPADLAGHDRPPGRSSDRSLCLALGLSPRGSRGGEHASRRPDDQPRLRDPCRRARRDRIAHAGSRRARLEQGPPSRPRVPGLRGTWVRSPHKRRLQTGPRVSSNTRVSSRRWRLASHESRQTLVQCRARLPAQPLRCTGHIGVGRRDVAGLHRT